MSRRQFQPIIDQLSDAFAVINAAGETVLANPRARDLFGDTGPKQRPLVRLIARIRSGEISLPYRIPANELLPANVPPPESLWVFPDPASDLPPQTMGASYCLIARYPNDPSQLSRNDKALLTLIGQETRLDIQRLRALMIDLERRPEARSEAIRLAAHLDDVLGDIIGLAELTQQTSPYEEDRFFVGPLLNDVIPALPKLRDTSIRFDIQGADAEPSPIYGHQKWMGKAFAALLTVLAKDCPIPGRITVTHQQIGDFVVVNGKVTAEAVISSRISHDQPGSTPSLVELSRQRHLQMARRILELHGGQLRLRTFFGSGYHPSAPVESFTLTLPTGQSAQERIHRDCGHCPVTAQARQYAQDIADLLDQKNILLEAKP